MKVSFVIPTKNEEKYLPQTLKSIKNQDFGDYEIVVADANSSDRTREIASAYGCTVVDGGLPAKGRNEGAKYSKGDLIVFTDSDIILPKGFLERAVLEMDERNLDVAGTLQDPILSGHFYKDLGYRTFYGLVNLGLRITEKTKNPCMQVCMLARRNVHEVIGGFNEELAFGEDSEYSKRAKKEGFEFGILKTVERPLISPRRLDREGFRILAKYIYFNAGRMVGMEFKENGRVRYF